MKLIALFFRFIIFLPFLGICGFFLYGNLSNAKNQESTASFVSVAATVIESRVRVVSTAGRGGRSGKEYLPYVLYEYVVGGHRYRSSTLGYDRRPEVKGYNGTAQSYVAGFPVGKMITAYYDPTNPSDSVLTIKAPRALVKTVFIIGLCGFFFLIIVGPGLWRCFKD